MVKDKLFYSFEVEAEGNDSWSLELENKNYKRAHQLSLKYQSAFSNQIASVVAFQMFENGEYERAAEFYSEIEMPFERIVLQYLDKVEEKLEAQFGLLSRVS